jgi:hypothetical protein
MEEISSTAKTDPDKDELQEQGYLQTKEEVLREVKNVRDKVGKDPRIHTRAQERVNEMLDEAMMILEEDKTQQSFRSLNNASMKVKMADQRFTEAITQKRWFATVIAVWIVIALGVSVWLIISNKLWPTGQSIPLSQVLLGAILWGVVGAGIDGLRELHTRCARQELDSNRFMWYFAHPLIGAGLGSIIFLLAMAGLLTTGQTQVLSSVGGAGGFNPTLVLLLAALTGFEEETVIRYLRETVRQVFRVPEAGPTEGG